MHLHFRPVRPVRWKQGAGAVPGRRSKAAGGWEVESCGFIGEVFGALSGSSTAVAGAVGASESGGGIFWAAFFRSGAAPFSFIKRSVMRHTWRKFESSTRCSSFMLL